jgi:cytochrome c oxidase cbb3-type subunit 2
VLVALGALSGVAEAKDKRPVSELDAKQGKAIFLRECSGCHGERGDGDGPASKFLDPRPRNFLAALFKLRTTPSGEPPATADLIRTLQRGIPGTAMPSFSFLSSDEERQVIAYVLSISDLLDQEEPASIAAPSARNLATAESIAHGKQLYEEQQCATCHGKLGKGDGPSSKSLKDTAGNPIKVRDFTSGVFRGGGEPIDLYYRFTTGMDGTPMPSFGDLLNEEERWALVDYIMSLRVPPKPIELPKNPIQAGRMVADKFGCRGCHVLDDGKGGDVGPDLRISGQKLGIDWVRTFLGSPRDAGKIYPWRPHRMPGLVLSKDEIDAAARYVAAMGKRKSPALNVPNVARFPADKIEAGKNLFILRCTECHTLGKVIETPPIKQQGPDLIKVAGRVDYDWAGRWIQDPKKIDPKTKMTVPGLTPEQVDVVRMFVWKASVENDAADQKHAARAADQPYVARWTAQ